MSTPIPDRSSNFRLLMAYIAPHRGTIGLGIVLALLASGTQLASPLVIKSIIDSLEESRSLIGPISILVALLIVGGVIGYFQMMMLARLSERIVLDARIGMVQRMFAATLESVIGRRSGELVTRVTSDTLLLRQATSTSIVGIINGAVMLVGTLVLMGVLDIPLLLVSITAIGLLSLLLALRMPAIGVAKERAQEAMGRFGGALETALRAMRTVKASRAEERQATAIIADAKVAADHGIEASRVEAFNWSIAGTGIYLTIIAILGFGAWRINEGAIQVSVLIAFLLYAFQLMNPIMELTMNFGTLQEGLAAASRIREIEELEPEAPARAVPAETEATAFDPAVPIIAFQDVSAAYGPDLPPALRNVTVGFAAQGHTAIVGPSGAGKTTMLSLMLRFMEPTAGHVALQGVPYAALKHRQIREHLAYVEQDAPLIPGTIRQNITFAHPEASDTEIWRALDRVRLTEVVRNLEDELDAPVHASSLSGGQRQRIALARAILRPVPLLLLDEATAQQDALTEVAIQEVIRDFARHGAVITIAHRLSTIIDADEIVLLEAGRIRARGDHATLLETDTLYRDLVQALRIQTETPEVTEDLVRV